MARRCARHRDNRPSPSGSPRLKIIVDSGQDPRHVKAEALEAKQAARDARHAAKMA